ncbi:MAG: phosphoribosylformylglycinamidine synthase I [Nanoarchaeota archaeon]
MKKVAIILFPGNNCENETAKAIESSGMKASIIRWNDTKHLKDYDGYVLPGGWSYEDRIRSGVIAAKDPIIELIKKESESGKVVLGICNGCQILVESALIPGLQNDVEMALAPNINPFVSGFYCTWVHIKSTINRNTAFNLNIKKNEILQIPIAHGEGNFQTQDPNLISCLEKKEQLIFKYCDSDGIIGKDFPINPNGSADNIAGIVNKTGNVLGMMPHPERACWMRQVPDLHSKGENKGPGRKIFESIREYLK